MIVVADTSPFVMLHAIGHLDVLPTLFLEVTIPSAVLSELTSVQRHSDLQNWACRLPTWVSVRDPQSNPEIHGLHAGETAAIHLALETNARLFLVDERKARVYAETRGLRVRGTLGVLDAAATEGLLDLADAFERVKLTNFWVSHSLLDAMLDDFQSRTA